LLRLDYLHRAQSPLDPLLRGKIRWVAARANRCAYGEAYATADLRRAGLDIAGLEELEGDHTELPVSEREALAFAHKLTRDIKSVTDEEVVRLIGCYGENQLVAMALLVGYANLLDRLVMSVGLPVESDGPVSPVAVAAVAPTFPSSRVRAPGPMRAEGRPGMAGGRDRSMLYQPELSRAWMACGSAFNGEASLDQMLRLTLSWLVPSAMYCLH
jgi:hypothetical protein